MGCPPNTPSFICQRILHAPFGQCKEASPSEPPQSRPQSRREVRDQVVDPQGARSDCDGQCGIGQGGVPRRIEDSRQSRLRGYHSPEPGGPHQVAALGPSAGCRQGRDSTRNQGPQDGEVLAGNPVQDDSCNWTLPSRDWHRLPCLQSKPPTPVGGLRVPVDPIGNAARRRSGNKPGNNEGRSRPIDRSPVACAPGLYVGVTSSRYRVGGDGSKASPSLALRACIGGSRPAAAAAARLHHTMVVASKTGPSTQVRR